MHHRLAKFFATAQVLKALEIESRVEILIDPALGFCSAGKWSEVAAFFGKKASRSRKGRNANLTEHARTLVRGIVERRHEQREDHDLVDQANRTHDHAIFEEKPLDQVLAMEPANRGGDETTDTTLRCARA